MITIPASTLNTFHTEYWYKMHPSLRYGQAFHQYLSLERIEERRPEKEWCDQLYECKTVSQALTVLNKYKVIDWDQ